MKAFYLLLFCFLTTCIVLQAQEYYTRYQRFTQKEGYRVLEFPNFITQDANGLLWIGGDNGLMSFDGTHFQTFRHSSADSNSVPGNHVAYNYQDKSGCYWAYVPDYGLYNFDPEKKAFRKFAYPNMQTFDINRYETLLPVETHSGKLWFIVERYGLACWDRKTKKLTPYKLCSEGDCENYLGNGWLTTIAEDPEDETLWLGTNLGLLLHFLPVSGGYETYKDPSEMSRSSPQRIVFDKENIWIGTWGAGIKCFNRLTKTFRTYKWEQVSIGTRNICLGLAPLNDSLFWVASADNGLMLFNVRQHKFINVHGLNENPLPLAIYSFFQNKEGVIWLAAQTNFVRINPAENFFSFHDLKPTFSSNVSHGLYSFLKLADTLYAGVYYGGPLLAYNTRTQQCQTVFKKELNGIRCLAKDSQNNLWIGTQNGLYILNTPTNRLRRFRGLQQNEELATLRVNDLLFDQNDIVWIASHQGLLKYDLADGKAEWLFHHDDIALHNREWVLALYKDAQGNIWFGTNNNGLGCYHKQTAQTIFFDSTRSKTYPFDQCNSVTGTSDGRILFASASRGLGELQHPFTKDEKMLFYNSENGLNDDRVESVFKDRQNNYWLFTHAGICLFDVQRRKVLRCFGKEDGLYEGIAYNRPYQDDDGLLYAGFVTGFQTFKANDFLTRPPTAGRIYLSSINVNGQSLPNNAGELQLRYDKTNLRFDFVFLTKTQSPDYVYAYKLSGVDDNWVHKGREASGQYSNLSPGSYTLHIKAMTADGKWSSQEFLLTITVKPPWYGSGWFYTLLGLLTASIIVGFYRYRIAQIHRQNELQRDFNKKLSETEMRALRAQMNPHFIFNCLNSINRYIVKSDHKTASNYLTKFAKLIRLILDNSATDIITLDREIQTLQLYMDMEKLRFDEAFVYFIDVEEGIDAESTFIPSMLIQPYVENAIWHGLLPKQSGESVLTIRFRKPVPDLLSVQIEDNGIGRKKAAELKPAEAVRKRPYGMQISKERIQLINELYNVNASVSIEDLEDGTTALGTRVILKIPLKLETKETNF